MRQFKWTKAHATFLPEVDAEHRSLFRMAEELHEAVRAGQDAVRVRALMQSLIASIEEHFVHEERIMQTANCESYDWHRQQHDTLRRKAKGFFEQFEAGEARAPLGFVNFMARWFRDHMALSDRMMGAQVRNSDRLQATSR
jgi:hemerythrin-like metal-binding protein